MPAVSFDSARVPIRSDIAAMLPRVWARVGQAGTWLTAEQRVAIAAETRHAVECTLCSRRKAALSPFSIEGKHDGLGQLPEAWIDVIHRVISDPGRLAKHWFAKITEKDISNKEYVELIGVVVTVVGIDTFCRGIGVAPPDLPTPHPGEPTHFVPEHLDTDLAWVPTLDPRFDGPLQREFYTGGPAHIRRALTYVPDTARSFWEMANVFYMDGSQMRDFAKEYRAITHAQIELVAGRVSAINQCVY
ncbi:MAG: alkylhydroperoxidase-related (seleno)protein [Alphaproteobacteria bacterium]